MVKHFYKIIFFQVIIFTSCEYSSKDNHQALWGQYELDTDLTNDWICAELKGDSVILTLSSNGNFNISSKNSCLKKIKGTWEISDDMAYYYFTINGVKQRSRTLFIETTCFGKPNLVFFE